MHENNEFCIKFLLLFPELQYGNSSIPSLQHGSTSVHMSVYTQLYSLYHAAWYLGTQVYLGTAVYSGPLIFQKFFVLYCFVFSLSGLYHDPKNHDRKKWSNLGDQ